MNRRWTNQKEIMGNIAMWAVRQSPYSCPDGLKEVIETFQEISKDEFDKHGMICLNTFEIEELIRKHLFSIPQFLLWNERKNGDQRPFGWVSRYDKPHPDDDFIDLDALIRNVAHSVYGANAEFEEREAQ